MRLLCERPEHVVTSAICWRKAVALCSHQHRSPGTQAYKKNPEVEYLVRWEVVRAPCFLLFRILLHFHRLVVTADSVRIKPYTFVRALVSARLVPWCSGVTVSNLQALQGFLGLSAPHLSIHPRLNCQSTIFWGNYCKKNFVVREYSNCAHNFRHSTTYIYKSERSTSVIFRTDLGWITIQN